MADIDDAPNRLVMTRSQAIEAGVKTHWTGRPCIHGHDNGRYVNGGSCIGCDRARNQNEKRKADRLASCISCRAKNPDRAAEVSREGARRARADANRAEATRIRNREWARALPPDKKLLRSMAAFEWKKDNEEHYRLKTRCWAAEQRAHLRKATPLWYNHDVVALIYAEAARISALTGVPHEVDHIVPFKAIDDSGHHVASGLHVADNLRVVTKLWNRQRRNRIHYPYEPAILATS